MNEYRIKAKIEINIESYLKFEPSNCYTSPTEEDFKEGIFKDLRDKGYSINDINVIQFEKDILG